VVAVRVLLLCVLACAAWAEPSPSPSAKPAPKTVEEQVPVQAEWLVKNLTSLKYKADYTPASLWEVDRFVAEGFPDGEPAPRLQKDVGRIIFAVGAYTGEVVRRAKGGRWYWGGRPDDPEAEVGIELKVQEGASVLPMKRALGRIREGIRMSVAAFGRELGLEVGAIPEWTKKAWSRPDSGR
jgi:hypothetical protein